MKRLAILFPAVLWSIGVGLCDAVQVTRTQDAWVLENDFIRVRVEPAPGRIAVLDKGSGYLWRQPRAPGKHGGGKPRAVRRLDSPPKIDGDLGEWAKVPVVRIPHTMTADAKAVDDEADCSATVRVGWDAKNFYLAAVVRDDQLAFAETGRRRWWDKDSVEFWVDDVQIGLNLSPGGCRARTADSPLPSVSVAMRRAPDGTGYRVEARVPWSTVHVGSPGPGRRIRFAVGVNDADGTGTREGQIYFPPGWRHSQPETFAEFALADSAGRVPPEKVADRAVFRDVRGVSSPAGVRFRVALRTPQKLDVLLTLTVPDREADLVVDVDMPDRNTRVVRQFVVLPPFLLDTPEAALVVADYCNGHLYPLNAEPFPRGSFFNGNRLDMPWLGVVDLSKGFGYALILDTSDDCGVRLRRERTGTGRTRAPVVEWWAAKRTFRIPRRLRYRFRSTGGYVALAKAYRAYARERGLLKTLAEKAKENPDVRRLFGAPDVWGDSSFDFARRAKALGVDKMLIHGESSQDDMRRVNELGYLTSRYDNYTDILPLKPGEKVRNNRGRIPDDVVLRADGKRQTAWLTFDKKTQFMKRCPALWLDAAKEYIPADLAVHPYRGRFIDVTTAEALYECFDPKHPLNRTEKRHCGEQLEKYVWDLGLVGGGEHGIWWGVPSMCYVEGMMSGGNYSWPAGHLRHPKTKEDHVGNPWGRKLPPFSQYEKYGIGHRYRVPLWELVFHDCIVTTWYWGDASDWLLDAAPEVTPKKDAFNILYGTIPLLWANRGGSWRKDREVFLRTYRNTCKLHEQIAGEEMLTHEFVTPDRAVQRTVFGSGTEVVVNFGTEPREVTVKGEKFLLPQNGFAVRGPRIRQSLVLESGKPVTIIETPGYRYEERGARGVTLSRQGAGRMHVLVGAGAANVILHPERAATDWTPNRWVLYRLDANGRRTEFMRGAESGRTVQVGACETSTAFDLLYGVAASAPDPAIESVEWRAGTLGVTVSNRAYKAAPVTLSAYLDRPGPERLLGRSAWSLPAAGTGAGPTRVQIAMKSDRVWPGIHTVLCVVRTDPTTADLCRQNNRGRIEVRNTPPPGFWDGRFSVVVEAGEVDRTGQVLSVTVDLRDMAARLGLKADIDPDSIRVTALDKAGRPGRFQLAEFHVEEGGGRAGALFWLPEGPFPPGSERRFAILFKTGKSGVWPPLGNHWDAEERAVRMPGYVMRFSNGVPVSLAPVIDGRPGPDFLRSLIYSSEKTGWGEEAASKVTEFTVVRDGPLCCVVRIRKLLRGGVGYTKTYTFFPDRIDLEVTTDTPRGCILSRAHYRLPGKYVDDKGVTADIDGKGDENRTVYGKNKAPKWYAVLGDGWAHSCVARGEYDHMAYWDGGYMGAVGLVGPKDKTARMTYVVHGPEKNAQFARRDWRRLTQPPRCRILPR
ncbi:MAG: hypothetical protein GXP31_06105 [Kiritimatiellaeota bacterium]|nr:hypothetical protein [Kiritimatiellota bacterium]